MATYAFTLAYWAGIARMVARRLRAGSGDVAAQAFLIVSGKFLHQGLVRVVACDAGNSRVVLPPTLAALRAIHGAACVLDSTIAQSIDVPPRAMASAAEIHGRRRIQPPGIEGHAGVFRSAGAGSGEIGRASCRERV